MLPLQQAREVRDSVLEYIKATFQFKERNVSEAFYKFIEDKKNGLFKGPYISLKTPFVSATDEEANDIPLEIAPSFPPYKHQLQAFHQLTTKDGHKPEPTLLTTGTGSGKTECFLYPILDYCRQINKYQIQKGVKVIILYPMNALASDQAKRLAKTIWDDERLRGKVTAGLFVGQSTKDKGKPLPSDMSENHIIENREAIIDTVPDILLTNFKMLDYGLMQQQFMPLWKGNVDREGKLLKFIILDELHTYDGVQGTDVANLLRRLKLKLNLPQGHLCPVGTSATIGSGPESKGQLCEYATAIFGEVFKESNVIEEHRISVEEYVEAETYGLPGVKALADDCAFKTFDTVDSYRKRLCDVWFGKGVDTPEEVGNALRRLGFVKSILNALKGGILSFTELQNELEEDKEFRTLGHQDRGEEACANALESIFALIAYAKRVLRNGKQIPMMYLQVQLWQRELSGVLRYVQKTPEFVWRRSLDEKAGRVALPMFFCRDCGASGWVTTRNEGKDDFSSDIKSINSHFMADDKSVRLLNLAPGHEPAPEYLTSVAAPQNGLEYIHISNLSKVAAPGDGVIKVQVCVKTTAAGHSLGKFLKTCPECNSSENLCIVGARTGTLSSVAISQILSSDFDDTDEMNRKILVFTNSVQDAAHQAGYYEARTFRFLFRQAMQYYINTLKGPVTLADLQDGFRKYWHEELDDAKYFSRFIPSDLTKRIKLKRDFRFGNGWTERFKKEFDLRVGWEIVSEFGFNAQLGRTLEKTGASAIFFKPETIYAVYDKMVPWLNENALQDVASDKAAFCHFVYGILQRMRLHGAVDHPFFARMRKEGLTRFNLNWYVGSEHFLNREFGRHSPLPHMVGINAAVPPRDAEMLDVVAIKDGSKNKTWWTDYAANSLNATFLTANTFLYNDFIRRLFDVMAEVGLVNCEAQGGGNYAICPDAIWISKFVKHIQCGNCQDCLCVASEDVFAGDGVHCLNYRCKGVYEAEQEIPFNYYQQVYNRHVSPRVHAHEHTGLLDRSVREAIEFDFKEHPEADSINVLSATSTLEMGIDIGDLNVMGNAGVPPEPSNFLQRVGRAGRKEGSALVLNYAHMREAHDMYYFDYPFEMMQGEINTPGCFLSAREILQRHFLAFCIDSWVSASENNALPPKVRNLALMRPGIIEDPSFIANRISSFIHERKESLKSLFRSQYDETVGESVGKFYKSLDDGGFINRWTSCFVRLRNKLLQHKDEFEYYRKEREKTAKNDEKWEELTQAIRTVVRSRNVIFAQNFVEYLTNEGLLPNYAFPETGVKLEATVYAGKVKGDEANPRKKSDIQTIELVRPASQGIKELAPGSFFYTQKHKLKIESISTFDWNDTCTRARICPRCDGFALEGEDGYGDAVCPKCGDPNWQMSKHDVLKFTSARSCNEASKSALDDSSEERERGDFVSQKHFHFAHNGMLVSYVMKNVGFGIEFCGNMVMTEVNYGSEKQSGVRRDVNSSATPVSEYGFIVCSKCGKATPIASKAETDGWHTKFCPCKEVAFDPTDSESEKVFKKLYLYRSLQTEAVKVLLPKRLLDAPAAAEMFKAGIERGMKAYYKSSAGHIQLEIYTEFNKGTQSEDTYLVLYDTVPGGTGYLAKICQPEEFSALLQAAYEKIRDCTCQYEEKDGCYHCILSYTNRYGRETFSRKEAEKLFKELVESRHTWETVDGSLGTAVTVAPSNVSSLEQCFEKVLEKIAERRCWEFKKILEADSYYFLLRMTDSEWENDILWHVRPQYQLTGAHGVKYHTISDYQFICVSATIGGEECPADKIPQWAVYTDGYAYHAKEPNMRFMGDKQKRDGIRESVVCSIIPWTLTWDDLELFEADQDDDLFPNSFARMIEMMLCGTRGRITEYAFSYPEEKMTFPVENGTLFTLGVECDFDGIDALLEDAPDEEVENVFKNACHYDLKINPPLGDISKEEWNAFWRRYNLVQFFIPKAEATNATSFNASEINRDEIKMFYPGYEEIVDVLLDNKIPFSYEGETELLDDDGIVLASAGMILPAYKIAIDAAETDVAIFVERGYKVISASEFDVTKLNLEG